MPLPKARITTRARAARLAFATLSLVAAACGGGGDGGGSSGGDGPTTPTPQPGTLSIAVASNAAITVPRGGSGTIGVSVVRGGSFTGPVSLSVSGAPGGVTASFSPATIESGSSASTLTLAVASTALTSNFGLIVTAKGAGVTDASTTMTLTIPSGPDYALAFNPTSVSVTQGGSASVTVTATRTGGFTGAIGLTALGLPAGVIVTDASIAAGASTTTLTFNALASAADASASVTIKSTAAGIADKFAPLSVAVGNAVPAGFTLSVSPTSASVAPGSTTALTATVARVGGFTGAVDVSVEGLPSGVTATTTTIASGATTGTITLTAASSAATASTSVTVRAKSTGLTDRTATVPLTVSSTAPPPPPSGGTYKTIAAGRGQATSCAIATDGLAYCWGSNSGGALGVGVNPAQNAYRSNAPVPVKGGRTYGKIYLGGRHVCALTPLGAAYCWGYNSRGQLGVGDTLPHFEPTPVAGGLSFQSLSLGDDFSCGITTAGAGYCWGKTGMGSMTSGNVDAPNPRPISGGLTWKAIAAGVQHACGVTTDGVAYCWGSNSLGESGRPQSFGTVDWIPRVVTGGLTYTSITAGLDFACGLATSGDAYCWGNSYNGELGNGATTYAANTSPVKVSGGHLFRSISSTYSHTCGVTAAGEGYCWGAESAGEFGNNVRTQNFAVPSQVVGGISWQEISLGSTHACAVSTAGGAYCVGDVSAMGIGTYNEQVRLTYNPVIAPVAAP